MKKKKRFLLQNFMVNLFKFMARTFLIESVSERHAQSWRASGQQGSTAVESEDPQIHRGQITEQINTRRRGKVTVPQFQAKFILSLRDIICNKPGTQ